MISDLDRAGYKNTNPHMQTAHFTTSDCLALYSHFMLMTSACDNSRLHNTYKYPSKKPNKMPRVCTLVLSSIEAVTRTCIYMCMYNLHALDSLEVCDHRWGSTDEEPPLQADPGAESALPCPTQTTAHWNTTPGLVYVYMKYIYMYTLYKLTEIHMYMYIYCQSLLFRHIVNEC